MASARSTKSAAASTIDADLLAELDEGDTFDERSIPVQRRIALIRAQLAEWNEMLYSSKIAYQTNKALGASPEELAPLIAQFSRARGAVKQLEQVLAELGAETRAPGPGRVPSA